MRDSDKRVQFIAEYISSYEEKIKLLNSEGLFDSAKLFELFAVEVCSMWYGQKFINLNVNKYNYSCVDLISEDKQLFIQVSTVKDIPSKIGKTLRSIDNSTVPEIQMVKKAIFFVLSNESECKIKDYSENNQKYRLSFTKEDNLITTNSILQKATTDLDFQIALYELLKKESDSIKDNNCKLKEAISFCKSVGLGNIDSLINNEYEIDRSNLIKQIRKDNCNNISIQGGAGSGKSVLCKKLVENIDNLVYARAENFVEARDINEIWGFNVEETLKFLNEKPIVFFIDSLEFIADINTKLDLLSMLYECVSKYPSARIITSCRTCDKNAFIKIENKYLINSYEVLELTKVEQEKIAKKYPIIAKMLNMNSYSELLKSPLYLNIIISKIEDIENINDENELREYIWENIICLKKKSKRLKLNYSEIKNTVEKIVFDRAKKFSLGTKSDVFDNEIIKALISEGIVLENRNTIRLKYDIYEDICFEHYFDTAFDDCKGNYTEFFNNIETFGRCVHRRYQIWISNKLLGKDNRERFLYELVFADKMPPKWVKQTQIGLVKSRYCNQFFEEYGQKILEDGILKDFINIVNLYAFEVRNDNISRTVSYILLKPSGNGRESLINIIYEYKEYKKNTISRNSLEKICADYAKQVNKKTKIVEATCEILQYIVEAYIIENKAKQYYKLADIINSLLRSIYRMVEYSKEWIKQFWIMLEKDYTGDDYKENLYVKDIIKDTLRLKNSELARYLPDDLCHLAEMFWTFQRDKKNDKYLIGLYSEDIYNPCLKYGLNLNADSYGRGNSINSVFNDNFFLPLFKQNFHKGLKWTVDFINKCILELSKKDGEGLINVKVNFLNENNERSYFGNREMWLSGVIEHSIPTVLNDLIYILKKELFYKVKNDFGVDNEVVKFAESVKKYIYENSNNVALLTIIADIGIEFQGKLPGYALDLVTSMDLLNWNVSKQVLLMNNPAIKMLEKQMLMNAGISSLSYRYNKDEINNCDLQTYVHNIQLYSSEEIKNKCYGVLDFLYDIIPNNKINAVHHLQIQKMDLRKALRVKVNESADTLIPEITGEAEKIVKQNEKLRKPQLKIDLFLNNYLDEFSKNGFELYSCINAIEFLIDNRKECTSHEILNKYIVCLIAIALNDKNLSEDKRTKFCRYWIEGINCYFSMGNFFYDLQLSSTLFSQIDTNVNKEIKNEIKELMLNCLLYSGQNGILRKIARNIKQYLRENTLLAECFFNTIVKLAEDEMNHQKYNAEYLKRNRQKKDFNFVPNMQLKLMGVDEYIKEDNKEIYNSQKDQIVNEYLFNCVTLDLSDFNMDNYDIRNICYAINCGFSLGNNIFESVVKNLIQTLIDLWKASESKYNSHHIIDVYTIYEVINFIQKELIENEKKASTVFEVLFTNIDFSKFTNETIEFYLDVFGVLLLEFFDSHDDIKERSKLKKIIGLLENKILKISNEDIKIKLCISLLLSPTKYTTSGDWSELNSDYSYQDRCFLNDLFSKYGKYHLDDMLKTINKLHIDKLLPEILLSIRKSFVDVKGASKDNHNVIAKIIREQNHIVLMIISSCFLNFSDQIKKDDDLTIAFEDILEMLIDLNYEEAATILDEFRIH